MSKETTLTRMSINRPLTQVQPYWNNSTAIRQEIQRFESVHPSIYAIYDLIESIPDPILGQQIRDNVVCIEGKKINHILLLNGLRVFYIESALSPEKIQF